MKLPLIKCSHCKGKGTVPDRSLIGPTLKQERVDAGVSGLSIANRIGLDKSTLHNMELGKVADRWTPAIIAQYRKAIRDLRTARALKLDARRNGARR